MKCSCGFCDKELKNGCMSPEFCKPCSSTQKREAGLNENVKICPLCKSEYLAEYEECPNCTITNKR